MSLQKRTEKNDEDAQEKYKQEQIQLSDRMSRIKHKILVLSGKGGVGKSTTSINLAFSLFQAGKSVGLLDVDIHGPSIPKMLNLEDKKVMAAESAMLPVNLFENFKVMSIGFLLRSRDDAVIVRGPLKYRMIRQFLKDVEWGAIDYLIIDSPPGTGDEPLTVAQSIENADGAVVVTTPQQVAIRDVRKSVTFCRSLNLPIIGVLENMSGFICPNCGIRVNIFTSGGGKQMAEEMNIPFLGEIPIDPQIATSGDIGIPYTQAFPKSPTAKAFQEVIAPILRLSE
ncbi:MAG TPA: Mrp/NBP35 family ATP-binding protein [Desulfobacterales bacterium]|nr:Mrp/NBP35 family ATP-binding protein [Desulfobacterales bacterium]